MKEQLIRQVPLFASLSEVDLHALSGSLRSRSFNAGQFLMQEGQEADRFFILVKGQVEVLKAYGTADERLLGVRDAGTFIGEMGLLSDKGLHTASVRAYTNVTLLEMTLDEFDALVHRQPSLVYEMLRTLSRRLDESENVTISDLREKNRQLTEAYQALEAAQEQIIEQERLERELEVAGEIQSSLLPRQLPEKAGYDFGALMVPMAAIGGDFFDFIPLGQDRLGLAVGDVSDHGVPAALFMAMTVTLLRAEARRTQTPAKVLQRVNAQLMEMNATGMYVTILYGVLDFNARELIYVRAGHSLPMIIDSHGQLLTLERGPGQLIGIFDEPRLVEQSVTLGSGSTLLLFTDGVYEAMDPNGHFFGLKRLEHAFRHGRGEKTKSLCGHILDTVAEYRGASPQQDDITLLSVRVG